MKRKVVASLLVGVLAAGMTVNTAGAASAPAGSTITGTGSGTVYSPSDIIDVVVPTEFKVAFNPLKVNIANTTDGLSGASQILSGTYAIQNRSTIPVSVSASFKVTADGKTVKADSAENVATYDAQTDTSKVTMAEFSLDLVTTAKGTAQTLNGTIADKETGSTAKLRTDATATGVKISKASTESIPLTATTAAKDVNFMLAAGPYTPTYNKETNKVEYKAGTGTFDTVAFSFTGTTTTNASKWAAVTTAPNVAATYTLTESTQAAYDSQPFSAYSKDVTIKTGDTDLSVTKGSADSAEYTFKTAPTVTMSADSGNTADGTKNKVTVLSLLANGKADATKSLNDLSITVTKQDDSYTAKIAKETSLAAGFYLLTIGKQSFTVEVK